MIEVQSAVDRILRETFPRVTFTGIWVRSRRSAYGDEILDIWAVYEGDVRQLQSPERPYLLPRLVDALQATGNDGGTSHAVHQQRRYRRLAT